MAVEHADLQVLSPEVAHTVGRWVEHAGVVQNANGPAGQDAWAALNKLRPNATDLLWLLAHCDDGIVWGRIEDRMLRLPHAWRAQVWSPLPREVTIQQLRIFGKLGELLLWRDEDVRRVKESPGESWLRGRLILDGEFDANQHDTRPKEDQYLLLGDELVNGKGDVGFTAVAERRRRREQIVPLDAGDLGQGFRIVLIVKHYFDRDPESGCVRRAATRLVGLRSVHAKDLYVKREG